MLIAERACERLLHDYAALNDAGHWEAVAALYVADGRMSRPSAPENFIEGRDAILASFRTRPPRTTRHVCVNIRVNLISLDEARIDSQILLFMARDQTPLVGSYRDRCLFTSEGWRFAERYGTLDFSTE